MAESEPVERKGEAEGGGGGGPEGAGGSGADDFVVPKLPRGRGLSLSPGQMMRIGMTLVTLIALVALQRPCSQAVGRFVTTFGEQPGSGLGGGTAAPAAPAGSARAAATPASGAAPVAPAAPALVYERLSPSMTDAELRAAIERAKRRAREAEASANPSTAPSPPAMPPPSVLQER